MNIERQLNRAWLVQRMHSGARARSCCTTTPSSAQSASWLASAEPSPATPRPPRDRPIAPPAEGPVIARLRSCSFVTGEFLSALKQTP